MQAAQHFCHSLYAGAQELINKCPSNTWTAVRNSAVASGILSGVLSGLSPIHMIAGGAVAAAAVAVDALATSLFNQYGEAFNVPMKLHLPLRQFSVTLLVGTTACIAGLTTPAAVVPLFAAQQFANFLLKDTDIYSEMHCNTSHYLFAGAAV